MSQQHTLSLADVPIGVSVRIRSLRAHPDVSVRLRELGFCEDVLIRPVQRGFGNLICEVYDTRVGLNNGIASSIFVTIPEQRQG